MEVKVHKLKLSLYFAIVNFKQIILDYFSYVSVVCSIYIYEELFKRITAFVDTSGLWFK